VRKVEVIFHVEPEGMWAETPDVPQFSAAAATLTELDQLVRDGLALHFEEDIDLHARFAPDSKIDQPLWWSWSSKEYATVSTGTPSSTQAAGVVHATVATSVPQYSGTALTTT